MTGDLTSLAAWRTALMVEVEVQLKAGKAIYNIVWNVGKKLANS